VSPDCPDSSLFFKSPYFCLAHLLDITVLLFVLQSDESALTEISLSAGKTPTSNRRVAGPRQPRRARHCARLDAPISQ
jgi:hypothetical protein